MTLNNSVKILVIGGGLAGLTMVSALNRLKTKKNLDITLIEPSDWHHNQTEWFKYCNGYTQKYSPTHLVNLVFYYGIIQIQVTKAISKLREVI